MSSLSGKVAIVTGASSGVGEELAKQLAREGVTVVIAARRVNRLEALASEIKGFGGEAMVVPTDLREQEQISNLVNKTIVEFGRIDILANVAGWGKYNWYEKFTWPELRDQFAVNVLAMAELTRQVVQVMKEQKSGQIINMASYASRIVFPPLTVYASTKYAVEGLSDGLRRELAPWGIRVTRVHPGGITGTEFNKLASSGGIEYRSSPFGRTSRENAVKLIVGVIKKPRRELLIGREYDLLVWLNRALPGVVDLAAKIWVKMKQRAG